MFCKKCNKPLELGYLVRIGKNDIYYPSGNLEHAETYAQKLNGTLFERKDCLYCSYHEEKELKV